MPVPSFEFTVSKRPILAPSNYQELDPCVSLTEGKDWHIGRWHGSGFRIKDLIQGVWWYSEASKCGSCNSSKTLCIYLDNDVHQFSANVKLELVCLKCGKFTQYDGAD
ncbi:MAG: hypothetical protein IT569_09640 [Leptospiraceae bacterium]|nr:hypothetical protein [Leptospiraceae bacterium]